MAAKSFDKLNYKYNGSSTATLATDILVVTQDPVSTEKPSITSDKSGELFYFAQPTANGYQVVDNEPKVIMKLYNTSQKNVFIGEKGNSNGVVISKESQWVFEYYDNGKFVSEPINLKF
jgi:hypothetical protein